MSYSKSSIIRALIEFDLRSEGERGRGAMPVRRHVRFPIYIYSNSLHERERERESVCVCVFGSE